MHRSFFSIKRVHLRVVEIGKHLLRCYRLTPARFDMLRIVMEHDEEDVPAVAQAKICVLLGVSGATVSRMLKALEKLGFVTRAPEARDRRCRMVSLTLEGYAVISDAVRRFVDNGLAEKMARRGLDRDRVEGTRKLEVLQTMLSSMRKVYVDAAPFDDPWDVAPLVPYVYTTLVNGRIRYGDEDLEAKFA